MTREQAEQDYHKMLQEWQDEVDRTRTELKEAGTLEPGLDGNRMVFKKITDKYVKKIKELQASVDE